MSLLQSLVPSFARSPERSETANGESQSARPVYEVKETAEAYGLTIYMPGVAKDGLEVTVDNETVSIKGRRSWAPPGR